MQNVSLNVDLRDDTNNNWQYIPLAGGCNATTTDPIAYNWDEPNNCLFTLIRTFDAQMIKANDKNSTESQTELNSVRF